MPSRQLSGRLKVAGTDRDNSLIFIRSKNLPYLVMTDQSASSTTSVPTLPSPLSSRFRREQLKRTFQSKPTHPSTYNFTQVQITQLALLFLCHFQLPLVSCGGADQPQKVVSEGHICDQIVQKLIKLQVMY